MRALTALNALKTKHPFTAGQSTDQRHNVSGAGQYPFSYESHHVVYAHHTTAHAPASCAPVPRSQPLLQGITQATVTDVFPRRKKNTQASSVSSPRGRTRFIHCSVVRAPAK